MGIKVYNVFYHVLADDSWNPVSDGTNPIGEAQIMNSVRDLNLAFNPYKIFFKYRGYNIIPNSDMMDISGNSLDTGGLYTFIELIDYSVANGFQNNESLNIFIVDDFFADSNGTILPGTAWYPINPVAGVAMPNVVVMAEHLPIVTIHEVGHCFGLEHTNKNGATANGPSLLGENVTRLIGPNFNAETNGDRLVDTPAAPSFYNSNDVNSNGVYVGEQVDFVGDFYKYELVPIKNFMNVNRHEHIHFQKEFTIGQGAAMHAAINDSSMASFFSSFEATIFDLYQPFERGQVIGNVVSVTNIDRESALVCRALYDADFRFQKGFTYTFPDNISPDPLTAHTDILPVVSAPPYNCPVIIAELGLDENGQPLVGQAVTIDRGTICTVEQYTSGRLYSTQVLGSMNITEQYLNEVQIKDPELYNNLLSQYYYILKKMTESGALKEEVFYKP